MRGDCGGRAQQPNGRPTFIQCKCASAGRSCALPMRVPNHSPILDNNIQPMAPELHPVLGKASEASTDSNCVLDTSQFAMPKPTNASLGGSHLKGRHHLSLKTPTHKNSTMSGKGPPRNMPSSRSIASFITSVRPTDRKMSVHPHPVVDHQEVQTGPSFNTFQPLHGMG